MKYLLMADDNEDDIILFGRAMRRAGVRAEAHFVADGEQALAYLRGEGRFSDRKQFPFPNLVVLDLKMPKMDGLEILAQIRRDARLTLLTVLFLTDSDDPTDINAAYDLNVNGYMRKTADGGLMEEMFRSIEDYWLKYHVCPTPSGDVDCLSAAVA